MIIQMIKDKNIIEILITRIKRIRFENILQNEK